MATGCRCFAVTGTGVPCTRGSRHLRYYYTGISGGVEKTEFWDGCVGSCNPLNCSNTACTSRGCTNARNIFCQKHGKECPGGRKCYGPQGQDPCPVVNCSMPATDAQARKLILDYIQASCGTSHSDGNTSCRDYFNNALNGYTSGRNQVLTYLKSCSLTAARNAAANIANVIRCSRKCSNCVRKICDTNIPSCKITCPGDTPIPGGQGECNENPVTWGGCLGNWWEGGQGVCHVFDFLPMGGCTKEFQTIVFFGGVAILAFVLFRRV